MNKVMGSLSGIGWQKERAGLDLLGYTAPLPLADSTIAKSLAMNHAGKTDYIRNPHTSSTQVSDLLRDPGLVEAVDALCGLDLQVWRSAFFSKSEGSGEIGWHHDKHFFDGDEEINLDTTGEHFSVLFALTEISHHTGMLEVVPGTHTYVAGFPRELRPFHLRPKEAHILRDLPPEVLAARRALPIPSGCFVIFHSSLLHRSLPHSAGEPRLGLAIRLANRKRKVPDALAKKEDILSFPLK